MLQMSALETLYHGQFILSTQLIKPNHLFIPPYQCRTTFFLKNLTPSNNVPGTTEGAQLTALQPI